MGMGGGVRSKARDEAVARTVLPEDVVETALGVDEVLLIAGPTIGVERGILPVSFCDRFGMVRSVHFVSFFSGKDSQFYRKKRPSGRFL